MSEGCFLNKQSSFSINVLLYNPGVNKRITLTDTSLHTKMRVSVCVIRDFQSHSPCIKNRSKYIQPLVTFSLKNPQIGT